MSASDMAAIQAAKRDLRRQIKSVLSGLGQHDIATQSAHAVRALLSLPEFAAARRLSIYLSMPSSEISTAELVSASLRLRKRVFVPCTYKCTAPPSRPSQPGSIMDMVEVTAADFEDGAVTLKPDRWGIPCVSTESLAARANEFGGVGLTEGVVPKDGGREGEEEAGLDVIVMPGLAFDREMGRVGHGKGFYDYFLSRMRTFVEESRGRKRMPFLVGLALNEQVLPPGQTVPTDPTDWRVDALVAGDGSVVRASDCDSAR
ncbi:5-formyltetrahydrofolate cyclo-ligase family protein [Lineolata rhizophorae]|uniref:5-formyltetrahydrofolate cyclo-ligase n=1 Tax=Lineolata rhizophorae TaxID=578093 RepID=A0A6A6NNA5_9PEZI|nr:5-formyltetrahydrofolate cyclo-ligase family protein [Lineolata rhizophorae]